MKKSDSRRAEQLRAIRQELDIGHEMERITTPPNTDQVARTQRRREYAERIVKALPLTTEALLVAISEVASAIDDPAPPSPLTVRRWIFLHQKESGIPKICYPAKPSDRENLTFLYEE